MTHIEVDGIIICEQREGKNLISLDIFGENFGIMRWFGFPNEFPAECLFENIAIQGRRVTETVGRVFSAELLSRNNVAIKQNNAQKQAAKFLNILRNVVFDGVPLDELLTLTRQAIRNFSVQEVADVVLLKALYLLCREEGLAVDLMWLNELPEEHKVAAKDIIFSDFGPVTSLKLASEIIESLEQWILSI